MQLYYSVCMLCLHPQYPGYILCSGDEISHISGLSYLRHRAGDCRHFIFIAGLKHWWQYCRQLRKNTSRLHAYNCNPRRTILGI